MRKLGPRLVWVVAFVVTGLALVLSVYFSSKTQPAKVDAGAVRQVERAAELALARPGIRPGGKTKLEELAGLDRGLEPFLKPAGEWLAPDDSREVEQVASASAERGKAGTP